MIRDPYQVLGISPGASPDEIKRAYRQKAKEYHPDLHPNDPIAAQKMNEAEDKTCIYKMQYKHECRKYALQTCLYKIQYKHVWR